MLKKSFLILMLISAFAFQTKESHAGTASNMLKAGAWGTGIGLAVGIGVGMAADDSAIFALCVVGGLVGGLAVGYFDGDPSSESSAALLNFDTKSIGPSLSVPAMAPLVEKDKIVGATVHVVSARF